MLNNPLLLRSKNNGPLTHIDFVRLRLALVLFYAILGSKLTKAAVFAIRIFCLVQEPFLRMFTLLATIF